MARRSRLAPCAEGRDCRVNRRIDSVVEIVGCNAITSQMSDSVSRNGYRDYSHTAPIELTSSLKEHFGRRVVHIIDTSNVENQTMDGLFRGGDEVKNLLDEKAGICVKQIRFKAVDNYAPALRVGPELLARQTSVLRYPLPEHGSVDG